MVLTIFFASCATMDIRSGCVAGIYLAIREGADLAAAVVCAASRSMRRQTDFAESTTNFATSSAADPVTTNTFQQPADAVTFCSTPASQWASCKSDSQKIRPRDALKTARDVTEPRGVFSEAMARDIGAQWLTEVESSSLPP